MIRFRPGTGRHRWLTRADLAAKVAELEAQKERLEQENGELACELINTARDMGAAQIRLHGLATAHQNARRLNSANEQLRADVRQLQSALANATPIDVPRMRRDVDPDDTRPDIPIGEFWADPARWPAPDTVSRPVRLPDAVDPDAGEIPRTNAA